MGQRKRFGGLLILSLVVLCGLTVSVNAQTPDPRGTGFSIEVSPAPLIETVKPGERKTLELRIQNRNTITEQLKLELQSFEVNNETGEVKLVQDKPPEVKDWVSFAQPNFSVKPGESTIQKIQVNTPASAGFTYTFAIVISRQNAQRATNDKTAIEGSVAVFSLLNIDRPGATRKLEISQLTASQRIYEYLPASFTLKLKNNGNSLIRPGGNVFIQRKSDSSNPVAVLPLNPNGSYLLPGVTRTFPVEWKDGFPAYVKTQEAVNVEPKQRLEWKWGESQIRIGRYVAHVVAVYNDGQRDTPVEAEISFWVIPWKILLGILFALIILIIGLIAIVKFGIRLFRKNRKV